MTDRVALYLRVSTADQDLEGQERELRAYAAQRGWEVDGVYAEKTSASGRVERREYDALWRDLRTVPVPSRRFTRVLVWSLDRWSRDPSFIKAVGSIEELEQLGFRFHSLREPAIDTPEDGAPSLGRDILRGILPAIASFESRRRSERTQLAMDQIRSGARPTRSGRPPGRPRKVTPEIARRILDLREHGGEGGTRLSWSQVAVRVKIPAGTCKNVRRSLPSEIPRVGKGAGGFGAESGGQRELPNRPSGGEGVP